MSVQKIFTMRRYASNSMVYAVVVCQSVSSSICHKPVQLVQFGGPLCIIVPNVLIDQTVAEILRFCICQNSSCRIMDFKNL